MGLLVSWGAVLVCNRIADKYAGPIVRLHGCRDVEHCRIPPWGYAVILLSLFGNALLWGYVGFQQAIGWNPRAVVSLVSALPVTTVLFYLLYYAHI
jgi:hypothetical protein